MIICTSVHQRRSVRRGFVVVGEFSCRGWDTVVRELHSVCAHTTIEGLANPDGLRCRQVRNPELLTRCPRQCDVCSRNLNRSLKTRVRHFVMHYEISYRRTLSVRIINGCKPINNMDLRRFSRNAMPVALHLQLRQLCQTIYVGRCRKSAVEKSTVQEVVR